MPYNVTNTFRPLTPIGEGLQNITRAMFSGPTPAELEDRAAQAEQRRMQAQLYQAQIDDLRRRGREADAKAADAARARADMESAPQRLAGFMLGDQTKGAELLAHVRGNQVDAPFGTGMTGGLDEQDVPQVKMRAPMPQGVDPGQMARISRLLTGIEAAKALPGNDNLKHLSDMVAGLFGDELRQGAMGGKVTPQQFGDVGRAQAAMGGKPLYHDGKFGGMDNFSGALVDPRLFNADVALTGDKKNTEVAHQGAYRAQAGASSAAAGLSNARRDQVREDALVPVIDPVTRTEMLGADGKPVLIRLSERGKALQRTEGKIAERDNADANKGSATRQAKTPVTINQKALREQFKQLANTGDSGLDANFENALVARAVTLAQDPDGRFWNNPAEAGLAAWDELTGGRPLVDATGSWRDKNKRMAPEGFNRQSGGGVRPAAPNPSAPQVAPPTDVPTATGPGGQKLYLRNGRWMPK